MKKSQKRLLSVLFHLAVLGCMVLAYDAGKALAVKAGWIKGPAKQGQQDEEKPGTDEQDGRR